MCSHSALFTGNFGVELKVTMLDQRFSPERDVYITRKPCVYKKQKLDSYNKINIVEQTISVIVCVSN